MTVHPIPGRRPVLEALRARRSLREVLLADRGAPDELTDAAGDAGVPVRRVGRAELDAASQGVLHQGAVALAPGYPYATLADLAGTDLVVALDGVTDPQNLGAIARSAEAAGAGGILLPKRRSVHVTPAVEKASAGAVSWLRIAVVANLVSALDRLADAGLWSVGLDEGAEETLWSSNLLDGRVVVVVGAEGRGLARLTAERVDQRVAIPMRGNVGSLNAGAAATTVLFEVVRRRSARTASPQPGGKVRR